MPQSMPPPMDDCALEPVRYTGKINTDKKYYDGGLPLALGVHHYQVFRANRKYPAIPGVVGWTYNHQPYLSFWKGKFYLQFLQGEIQEHTPPTRIALTTSQDGIHWSVPKILFPPYDLPDINDDGEYIPAGTQAVMHQRMGFYQAPNGKLLGLGFYGYCTSPRRSPNTGNGIGRVVCEIDEDGTFGQIYFIRYNRHAGWNESNTGYPFYKSSDDKEFISACNALLSDKLMTFQWWEEDRARDGFYSTNPTQVPGGDTFTKKSTTAKGAGKAFNYYTRADGVVVGIWKNQYGALSSDRGKTWTSIAKNVTLLTSGAKTWAQRTDDDRFAIVHNQSATRRNRFPMALLISEDGHDYDRLYALRGDVPPGRYQALHKNPGLQYFRGIIEGNGDPPGNDMWTVYSVNKEDIWISRTPTPIRASMNTEVSHDFEDIGSIEELGLWNLYMPTWSLIAVKGGGNKYLELTDEEPYDFAKAVRIFPASATKRIEFRFQVPTLPQGSAAEVEVQDQRGRRVLKLRIDRNWLSFDITKVSEDPVRINPSQWNHVVLKLDCDAEEYEAWINGLKYPETIEYADEPDMVERIVFRTGPYRNFVPSDVMDSGIGDQPGFDMEDLPGSENKSAPIVFRMDDLKTSNE